MLQLKATHTQHLEPPPPFTIRNYMKISYNDLSITQHTVCVYFWLSRMHADKKSIRKVAARASYHIRHIYRTKYPNKIGRAVNGAAVVHAHQRKEHLNSLPLNNENHSQLQLI